MSSVLSTTAVQNWFMHYSIGKNRCNGEDDTSAMVKSMESSSRHLCLLRLHDWFHVCKLYSSPITQLTGLFSVIQLCSLLYLSGVLFKWETV
jgi:hypothetical protein